MKTYLKEDHVNEITTNVDYYSKLIHKSFQKVATENLYGKQLQTVIENPLHTIIEMNCRKLFKTVIDCYRKLVQ